MVALGASTNDALVLGSSHALTFKTMADALVLRNQLTERFERAVWTVALFFRPDITRVDLRVEREQVTQARQLVRTCRREPRLPSLDCRLRGLGTVYLGIRVALESVPVALLPGLRWTAARTLLATLVRLAGEHLPPTRTCASIALTGFLMVVIGNGGGVWAQQHGARGLAAVVWATVPFWSVLLEGWLPSASD